MGISVIYFTNFQYNKAEEQRRVDPVVRTGPKSVLALSRMSSAVRFILAVPVSCELGLIETTGPTGGTQHREYWGGPANGQAAACRRRPRR